MVERAVLRREHCPLNGKSSEIREGEGIRDKKEIIYCQIFRILIPEC